MSDDRTKLLAACVDYRAMLDKLEAENAELRADKERLDWIARNRSVSVTERPLGVTLESLRASIDAAMKENYK